MFDWCVGWKDFIWGWGILKCLNGNVDGGFECGSFVIVLLKFGNRDNGVV